MNVSSTFSSFFLGGFECSTHRRLDGVRLDLLKSTGHDRYAEQDYSLLKAHAITTARDGLRWHLIEQRPGHYDWSSFLPMLLAARKTGVQVVWDVCHYGWPDDIDIWSAEFPRRFARFAAAVATLVREETSEIPFYCPINEISFWAWAGGDTRSFAPAARRRGMELKRQLVRASIEGIHAIRAVDPRARIVSVDPVIHVVPKTPRARKRALENTEGQYEAWDMLAGRQHPELGGSPDCLDVIGVNYYSYNQWFLRGDTIRRGDPLYRPFRDVLAETYQRYQRPLFIAETGAEGDIRQPWFRYICDEVYAAIQSGIPIEGICLYPVTDYPGWSNDRHCPSGLFGMADVDGDRPVYRPLADELAMQQLRFSQRLSAGNGDTSGLDSGVELDIAGASREGDP